MNTNKSLFGAIALSLILLTTGCDDDNKSKADSLNSAAVQVEATKQNNSVIIEGDDQVLAVVNDTHISQYDVENFISSTFSQASQMMLDEKGKEKVLQSLVQSRAISLLQQSEMDQYALKELDKKVAAYREQLLVKQYLADNVQATPVTRSMVQEYYAAHPELFGASSIRSFEMITSSKKLSSRVRDQLLQELQVAPKKSDWKQLVASLQKKGLPVSLKMGKADDKLLTPQIKNIIAKLEKGEVSAPAIIEGSVSIARVTDIEQIGPKPLNEVSNDIRKMLLPLQLKEAVKKASATAISKVKVEYR